jgi:Protein of unknown function (DUF2867)
MAMEQLPHIDEHAVATSSPPDVTWESMLRTLRRTMSGAPRFSRLLGADPSAGSDHFDGGVGQTLPGFRVVDAEPGRRITLEGRHRFARYRLTIRVDGDHVRARTDAAFPGLLGRLYRAAVIGSGAHRVITRRMLRQMASDRAS